MKKTTKPLSLNRETLRTLAGVDLERAVGGMMDITYYLREPPVQLGHQHALHLVPVVW